MSSILTNSSAMVALQTLKSINSNLAKTQAEISTGKSVASAKDNSAVWAISKVMEADVNGFTAISDSLSLGESTIAVARQASETVTDLLTQMKGKIVAAQEQNVDRGKLQTDINALRDQISSVVGAAQFNGLNLVQGTDDVNVLSSLDRSNDGNVSASHITVARQDLTTGAGTVGTTAVTSVTAYGSVTAPGGSAAASGTTTDAAGKAAEVTFDVASLADGDIYEMTINGSTLTYTAVGTAATATDIAQWFEGQVNALGLEGISASETSAGVLEISNTNAFEAASISLNSTADANIEMTDINGSGAAPTDPDSATIEQRAETIDFSTTAGVNSGDSYKVTVGSQSFNYIAGDGETMEDVVKGIKTAIDSNLPDGVSTKAQVDSDTGQWSLAVDDDTGGQTLSLTVTTGGTASGGLFGLGNVDVTTDAGASAALDNIETLINTAIDAAADFGSAAGRVETQNDFIGKLTDSLKTGIGAMVDADMEAASARLQALQVQQQLGTQALSIANQAPQNILSLFR
jgi:flagellin